MPETTDWNELTLPTEHQESSVDEDEWGEILNAMFEGAADELLIKRGPLSDRPSGGTSVDSNRHRMYLAEDQDPPLLSVDSETEGWIDINTGSSGGDADTLDGYDSSEFGILAEDDTITGAWTFDQTITGDISGDADTLDSLDSSQFLRSDQDDTTSGTLTADALESTTTNGTHIPDGSDDAAIQTALDAADPGGAVALDPSVTYTISNELTMGQFVTLYCNGATMEVDSDTNVLALEAACAVHDIWVDVTASAYTSDVIVVDTDRMSGGLDHLGGHDSVHVDGDVRGIRDGGSGLAMYASSTGGGIGVGSTFHLVMQNLHKGIHIDPTDSYINGPKFYVNIVLCRIGVDVLTNADLFFYGDIQPHQDESDIAIRTADMASRTVTWEGVIWDVSHFNTNTLVGPKITYKSSHCSNLFDNGSTDGSVDQMGFEIANGRFIIFDYEDGRKFERQMFTSTVSDFINDNRAIAYYDSGRVRIPSSGQLTLDTRDPTSEPPDFTGELTIANNSFTSSGNHELAVGQGDGSWVTMGGDTFTP